MYGIGMPTERAYHYLNLQDPEVLPGWHSSLSICHVHHILHVTIVLICNLCACTCGTCSHAKPLPRQGCLSSKNLRFELSNWMLVSADGAKQVSSWSLS